MRIRAISLGSAILFALILTDSAMAGKWSVLTLPQKTGQVRDPYGVATDRSGNIYVSDGSNATSRIQKRDAEGVWSVVASYGVNPGQVNTPAGLYIDKSGNLYVADYGNYRVQKRDSSGKWTIVASYGEDAGQVHLPYSAVTDEFGNLYVSDVTKTDGRIQKRDALGKWSVIASYGNGIGQVNYPTSLSTDSSGNLYVVDCPDNRYANFCGRIQMRNPEGHWTVIASFGYDLGDVFLASSVSVDDAGDLYVADNNFGSSQVTTSSGRIQKRDANGKWSLVASAGDDIGEINDPAIIATDGSGNLIEAEFGNDRIQKRDADGNWSVLATEGSDPGQIYDPDGVAMDRSGNLYVSEYKKNRVSKRDVNGDWSLLMTEGVKLGQVIHPFGLTTDEDGILYVADCPEMNQSPCGRIQKRDIEGNWTLLATTGEDIGEVDEPNDLTIDGSGDLYVSEVQNTRIQMRNSEGNWSVQLIPGLDLGETDWPSGVTADQFGNLYVADCPGEKSCGRIQKRDAKGIWTLIAGFGDELGQVDYPNDVAADETGNLYISEGYDYYSRIQKRDARRRWSILAPYGGDLGRVYYPTSLTTDGSGNLYVADADNFRIQKYVPGCSLGDIDKNDAIQVTDAIETLRIAAGLERPTESQSKEADANLDGKVTILDVTLILRWAVGLSAASKPSDCHG